MKDKSVSPISMLRCFHINVYLIVVFMSFVNLGFTDATLTYALQAVSGANSNH